MCAQLGDQCSQRSYIQHAQDMSGLYPTEDTSTPRKARFILTPTHSVTQTYTIDR